MNIPKLRFPEFSGEWEEKKLNKIFYKITKRNTDKKNTNVITNSATEGLISQRDYFDKDIANIEKTDNYFVIQNGDFVYNPRKSSSAPYGPFTQYKLTNDGIVSPLYLCLRKIESAIDSKFLESYFKTACWHQYIYENGSAGARHDRVSIHDEVLLDMPLKIPSLPEQQKIADFLSTVDSIIASETKILNALQKKKKALMQKLFSQQIRFKADDGSEFPEWVEKKLGEVCDVRDGTHDSPKYQSKGYPFITTKNLVGGRIDYSTASLISKDDYEQFDKRSHVDDGDILMPMIGTIGGAVIVKKECDFAIKNVALIKNNENIVLTFFLYQFLFSNNIVYQFHLEKKGGTQQFIALDTIRKLKIVVPTKEEQQKIADCLSSLDNLIQNQQKIVKNWQQRKRGLLQGMFI